jgi:amidase
MPEFGLGSHTHNRVYGATHNAYDQSRTAGGSSGGAAVALALRMAPVADGSDYGGSLRNPAGWNNVFGLRPGVGRVPIEAPDMWLPSIGVCGPMARTTADLAMLLSVQAGYDPRAPLSLDGDGSEFAGNLERDVRGKRIAFGGDFNGAAPCEPEVIEVCRAAFKTFEALGCVVEEAVPDYPSLQGSCPAISIVAGSDLRSRNWDQARRLRRHGGVDGAQRMESGPPAAVRAP